MRYMPDQTPEGRLPDRQYFWNVLNTLMPDYVMGLIEHATKQRMSAEQEEEADRGIEITDEWWNKLTACPFVSCKTLLLNTVASCLKIL